MDSHPCGGGVETQRSCVCSTRPNKVRVVVVCHVINRNWLHTPAPHLVFNIKPLLYISICLWSLLRSQAFLCGNIVIFLTLGNSCCSQMVCTVIHKDSTVFVHELSWGYLESPCHFIVFSPESLLLRLSFRDIIIA